MYKKVKPQLNNNQYCMRNKAWILIPIAQHFLTVDQNIPSENPNVGNIHKITFMN